MGNGHFVGIDVSKDTLDLSVVDGNQQVHYSRIENSANGMKEFFGTCPKQINLQGAVFCMEHTGIYCFHAVEFLMSKKCQLWIESAAKIKKSLGLQRGKSDKVDAFRIAIYAFKNRDEMKLWQPARPEVKRLKKLLSMRSRLIGIRKMIQVPIKENAGFSTSDDTQKEQKMFSKTLKAVKQDIDQIDKGIMEIIKSDEQLSKTYGLITSIDGVGTVVAANMLVVTNEFKSFENAKQFACYSGIAPFEYSSGKSLRGKSRVSHFANMNMKALLHLAALSSIRFTGELRAFYQRKVLEGKNKMLVLNAVRNKIIHRVFAVVRDGVAYQKNYTYQLQTS